MVLPDKSWANYYKDLKINEEILNKNIEEHIFFINKIKELANLSQPILETGVGSGLMSIYLARSGYDVVGIDNDKEVIKQADENNKLLGTKVKNIYSDLFKTSFKSKQFRLAFSQGTMEHFSNKQVLRALEELTRIAEVVIFSVPTIGWGRLDYGDERILSKKYWEYLLGDCIKEATYYIEDRHLCVVAEGLLSSQTKVKSLLNKKRLLRTLGPLHKGKIDSIQVKHKFDTNSKDIADPAFSVQFLYCTNPSYVFSNQTFKVSLALQNNSSRALSSNEKNPIRLSYQWYNLETHELVYSIRSIFLADNLKQNEILETEMWVTAPSTVGTYELQLDVVEEGIDWFSRKGAQSPKVNILVIEKDADKLSKSKMSNKQDTNLTHHKIEFDSKHNMDVDPSYNVNYLHCSYPKVITSSQQYWVRLALKNNSNRIWSSNGENPILLKNKWKDMATGEVLEENGATFLANSIKPNEILEIDLWITAPSKASDYEFSVDIMEDKVAFFSDRGAQNTAIAISVIEKGKK